LDLELKWLEDYLALAEYGNFSRAAEARFVTQPAFGRRIKALEGWLGVDLIDRHQYPTTLTPAGEEFVRHAQEWVNTFHNTRSYMRARNTKTKNVVIVTQHSLTVTFIPDLLNLLRPALGELLFRVDPNNLHDCLDALLAGRGDFLLCYNSPEIFPQLETNQLLSMQIGIDRLVPVSRPAIDGNPIHTPAHNNELNILGYPTETFFGKLLEREFFGGTRNRIPSKVVCESALVEGVKAMTLAGSGLAWLPERGVCDELKRGALIRVESGLPSPELKIMIYRQKEARIPEVEAIWKALEQELVSQ